jgi:Sulfotransferase family
VIGAARAGTTSLHYYLSLHPGIQMSAVKEPHFFSGPAGEFPYGAARVERMQDYRALFDPAVPVRGEASPGYAAYPRRTGVATRIREQVPGARLIYLVRDPVQRTISHYRHRVATEGEQRGLAAALGDMEPTNIYLCASRYATQIEQYQACFPADRILVIDQADLRQDREQTLRRIFAFLGVDSGFSSPEFAREYRGSDAGRRFPAWYRAALRIGEHTPLALVPVPLRRRMRAGVESAVLPALPDVVLEEGLHARLVDVLGPEAERFGKLTGLDITAWQL